MGKKSTCNARVTGDEVLSLGWEKPLEEGMTTTPVFLSGESHGQRSLVGYSPWSHKESDTIEATEHARMSKGKVCWEVLYSCP